LLLLRAAAADLLADLQRGAGIEAEEIGHQGHQAPADADAAAHHADAAPVFDVAARPLIAQFHTG
jgi:hypothetical protein